MVSKMNKKLPTHHPHQAYIKPNDKLFQLYQLLCLERSHETYYYDWLVAYNTFADIYLNSFKDERSAVNFAKTASKPYINIAQRHQIIDELLADGVQFTPHNAYFGYDFTIYPTYQTAPNQRIAIHYEWLANNREYFGYDMGHFIVNLSSEVANIIHLQNYGVNFSNKVLGLTKKYAKELAKCNPYVMDDCIFDLANKQGE